MTRMAALIWMMTALRGLSAAGVAGADELYSSPRADEVRSKVLIWAAEQPGAGAQQQEALKRLWTSDESAPTREELLDRVIDSFAVFDQRVANLAEACRNPQTAAPIPAVDFVEESGDMFFRANVRLFAGRRLVERLLFDEAYEALANVDPRQVVDPPALFFHRAVAAQGLLEISAALESLNALQKRTEDVPLRYSTTAALMQAELQNLQEKSLGEVARMMSDSERRLDLGRAGEKVQGVQERIITNLDELIKKMEEQANGGGGGAGQGNSNQSDSPAQDSTVKGSTAPGTTDPKQLSKEGKCGDLPEKEQAKAKNLINRNFPSHYQQAIEMYFKKLANRPAHGK